MIFNFNRNHVDKWPLVTNVKASIYKWFGRQIIADENGIKHFNCQWAWLMFVWQWKGLNAIHRRGHSTKLVVRYFVYYHTIWWTITDTGACVPRTKISSWPFTYAFTCYSNPLNVKYIICLFICRVSKPIFIYWMYAVVKNVSTRAVVPVPPWLDVRKGRNTFYVIKCCILGENR